VLCVDEAHHNFHTATGRYRPFAEVARADRFQVRSLTETIATTTLTGCDLLVTANALNPANVGRWTLPTPSAFTAAEIETLRDWVVGGHALMLIADHMPFPGAAADLAHAFGFTLSNGFARQTRPGPITFRRIDGSLATHPVVTGRTPAETIDSVTTFTGEAFRMPPDAISLLTFRDTTTSLEPRVAWQFDDTTPRRDVTGWSQGAIRQVGRGRLAVFGEAAMFSAQRTGGDGRMGMNHPAARQNERFLLNLLHWLATPIDP